MEKKDKIVFGYQGKIHLESCENIVYLESEGKATKVFCFDGKELIIKRNLSLVEEKLPDESFFKIHRSFIINVDYLETMDSAPARKVLLQNGVELRIANKKYKEFLQFLKNKYDFV